MSLATEPQLAGVHGAAADRFAAEDEARMRELTEQIRANKNERETKLCPCGCLGLLGECQDGKPRAAPPLPPMKTFTPPAPPAEPKESPMPCSKCGKDGHNARSCSKTDPKPALPAPPKARAAAPAKRVVRSHAGLENMEIDELLQMRDEVEAEIATRLDQAEKDLAALRAAVSKAAQRAREAA